MKRCVWIRSGKGTPKLAGPIIQYMYRRRDWGVESCRLLPVVPPLELEKRQESKDRVRYIRNEDYVQKKHDDTLARNYFLGLVDYPRQIHCNWGGSRRSQKDNTRHPRILRIQYRPLWLELPPRPYYHLYYHQLKSHRNGVSGQ